MCSIVFLVSDGLGPHWVVRRGLVVARNIGSFCTSILCWNKMKWIVSTRASRYCMGSHPNRWLGYGTTSSLLLWFASCPGSKDKSALVEAEFKILQQLWLNYCFRLQMTYHQLRFHIPRLKPCLNWPKKNGPASRGLSITQTSSEPLITWKLLSVQSWKLGWKKADSPNWLVPFVKRNLTWVWNDDCCLYMLACIQYFYVFMFSIFFHCFPICDIIDIYIYIKYFTIHLLNNTYSLQIMVSLVVPKYQHDMCCRKISANIICSICVFVLLTLWYIFDMTINSYRL